MSKSRMAVSLAEYKPRVRDERWLSLIASLSKAKAARLGECRQIFSTWSDSNGHTFYRPTLCQQRDVCPTCSWVYNEELVAPSLELYQLLCNSVGFRIGFAEVEVTLPYRAQRLVDDSMLGRMRRTSFKSVDEVLSEDGRFVLGAVASTHHWHSSSPLKGWFPHVHLTVLGLAYERDTDRFVPIDLYSKAERLSQFSQVWRERFLETFGYVSASKFVTHWHYGSGFATAEHWFRYQFRRPVIEVYNAVERVGDLNSVNIEWVKRALIRPTSEKRHQWYGFLSDGVKSAYLRKLRLSIERKSVRDRIRRKVHCPDCGDDLVCIRHGTSYEELQKENGSKILAFRGQRRTGS